ncbi:MAG: ribose 5-phosphate isomerase B [Candidatus Omnitrophica bacterium]|nr:ribose 5-phosphate isomerase B [Candidatus Omnitrophota bacterium]
MKPILIASDHAGFGLKEWLKDYLKHKRIKVKDLGTYSTESCDYPEFAYNLAKLISEKKYKQGVLICKSGIGNSIVANRFPGVRAALCYKVQTAELSRLHNDSNVLVLGSGFVTKKNAGKIVDVWLSTGFEGGRHKRRLNKITEIEKLIRSKK